MYDNSDKIPNKISLPAIMQYFKQLKLACLITCLTFSPSLITLSHLAYAVDFDNYLVTPPGFLINITANSVTPRFFNVRYLETTDINYTLDVDADVTIKIYDYPAKVLKRTLLNNQSRLAGPNSEEWDGKDGSGVLLPKGSYIYKIDAQATGGNKGRYDPLFVATPKPVIANLTTVPSGTFSAFKGERLQINYDINMPASVTLIASGDFAQHYGEFIVAQPRPTTGNVDYWNGRNTGNGNIVAQNPVHIQSRTERLPENYIVIQDYSSLDITALTSNPYTIRPLYNEVTDIAYTLNESATVTVKILTPDGNPVPLKVLEQSVARSAGTYTVSWDGRTTAGETIAEEGNYRVVLEAVDSNGATITRVGNVTILY